MRNHPYNGKNKSAGSNRGNHNVTPFQIKDCALIMRTTDILPALNLREFRAGIAACPVESLYHHFCETVIRPSFDDPEFHNDFARWARRGLHDHILAERLEILDPYAFADMEELRRVVLELIDDRLSEVSLIPWTSEQGPFHFLQATTVVFDTGKSFRNPEEMRDAVAEMTTSSIYYHFWEARRRTPEHRDDLSAWLSQWNKRGEKIIKTILEIDFYFLNLKELQNRLIRAMAVPARG